MCSVISGHRPPQTLSVGAGVARGITAREPAARRMPRSPTLSPVSDPISCGVAGGGNYGGFTALTGEGERGHRYNAVRSHGVYMYGSYSKAHRWEASGAGSVHPGAVAADPSKPLRYTCQNLKNLCMH